MMKSKDIAELIKRFKWQKLNNIYGSAHSSIIGFIAYEWLNISNSNTILDGAPSPITGNGRRDQQNSDLLLCKDKKPFIPVEVETQVSKYKVKLQTLVKYKEGFKSIEFGLLYLTNLTKGENKYKHNWDDIKKVIIENFSIPIILVSTVKEKIKFSLKSEWSELIGRNDYSSWEIVRIEYWVFDNKSVCKGILWEKNKC